MTQQELKSYRFDGVNEPSDEQLAQLMANAAEKVKISNQESDRKFFEELRCASEYAKNRSSKTDKQ